MFQAENRGIQYTVTEPNGNKQSSVLNIMTVKSTIEYIREKKCSVARFGDAELYNMFDIFYLQYQKKDDNLKAALFDILLTNNENCLVCLPGPFVQDWRGYKQWTIDYWKGCIPKVAYPLFTTLLKSERTFWGDTQITRPYIDYVSDEHAKEIYPLLKTLWKDRDLLIVEGRKTRLGVGNDLFADSASIQRILCPPENSFSCVDEIEQAICESWNGKLVLIALGPTATVLASRLSKKGIQTLDVGHIDIEYEWFLRRAPDRVLIPGKYVNEVPTANIVEDIKDEIYLSQIIKTIQ